MPVNAVPETYQVWRKHAQKLLDPLIALMVDGGSEIPLTGKASDHDANADRLEAFARPCLLASLYLNSAADPDDVEDAKRREKLVDWFRKALVIGSDPNSEHYWGANTNYHQNGVEIGLLAVALHLSLDKLWEPLSLEEKEQVARWMATNRGIGHHWNNHFYFSVFTLEFLQHVGFGRPSDKPSIDFWMNEMEAMYRGGGWFMDGVNQTYDHYNAYSFHYYGMIWAHLYGHTNPERARRWIDWAREFVDHYQHFFAASGEHPAFGRSITYRFNATGVFSLAAAIDASPLSHGKTRRLCTRNLEFFLNRPIMQEQGAIGIGWTDVWEGVSEPYSCAGSVYWCAKAFTTFLMPPEHPFWTAEEEALEAEKGDFVHVMSTPGLTTRSVGGEVEIINAGTEITPMNHDKFGPWKWGKLAYRTGIGFTIGADPFHYSRDCGLTCQFRGEDRVFGRHYTTPLAIEEDHSAFAWAMGHKTGQVLTIAETYLWWRSGWILQVHWFDAYQPAELTLGGFSLSSNDPSSFVEEQGDNTCCIWSGESGTALQNLSGFKTFAADKRTDDSRPRIHVQAPFHYTPLLQTGTVEGEGWLAALAWAGTDHDEARPWKIIRHTGDALVLEHPSLGEWQINNPVLAKLAMR